MQTNVVPSGEKAGKIIFDVLGLAMDSSSLLLYPFGPFWNDNPQFLHSDLLESMVNLLLLFSPK